MKINKRGNTPMNAVSVSDGGLDINICATKGELIIRVTSGGKECFHAWMKPAQFASFLVNKFDRNNPCGT